jgi:nucleoside-diphosphate-sugar epimerase
MKLFITGATGVLGRPVVRMLREQGHAVRALARSASNRELLLKLGAEPVRADLFHPDSLWPVLAGVDGVLHLATRIPPRTQATRRSSWEENGRIRIEGTRNLVDAALRAGVGSFLYPSVCFVYPDSGDRWISAEDTDPVLCPAMEPTLAAERQVARFSAAGGRGMVLRMGYFYGPEAESSLDTLALARRGAAILAGSGDAYYPSLWVDDAATAVVEALRAAPAGIYDIVDDTPLTRRELARAIAEAAGRPFLFRSPGWLLKLVGGSDTGFMMRSQRVSNERFCALTGWEPAMPDAREGWKAIAASLHPQPEAG